MKKVFFGIWVCILIAVTSCNEGTDAPSEFEQLTREIEIIDADLAAQGLTPIKDPSGVRILINQLGTGLPAQPSDILDVNYVGRRFSDKVVFDQDNADQALSAYIVGWGIALSKLPAGSVATIIIPSYYGYGVRGNGTIPGNTTLEFDVDFRKATMTTAASQKLASDTVAIDAYLDGKNIEAVKDSTGVRYVITTPGTGPSPLWYDQCTIKYSIKLLTNDAQNVITLERSPNDDFYSRPVDYIHGMKIGLQKLSRGSKAVFYIPSGLAFGPQGASDPNSGVSIPANANVIFEVELIDFD